MEKRTKSILWGIFAFIVSFVILTMIAVYVIILLDRPCIIPGIQSECLRGDSECLSRHPYYSAPGYCSYENLIFGAVEILVIFLSLIVSYLVYKRMNK
jgi:hypothetical protein